MGVLVAELVVIEGLRLGQVVPRCCSGIVSDVLLIVVTTGLAVAHAERSRELMTGIDIGEAGFGIKEMVMNQQRQILEVLVIDTVTLIAYVAILQISVQGEPLMVSIDDIPVTLGIAVGIQFVGLVAVVLIVHRKRHRRLFGRIIENAPVGADIVIGCSSELDIHTITYIARREDGSCTMFVKPFLIETIGLAATLNAPISELLLFILLIIAVAVRIMERGIE